MKTVSHISLSFLALFVVNCGEENLATPPGHVEQGADGAVPGSQETVFCDVSAGDDALEDGDVLAIIAGTQGWFHSELTLFAPELANEEVTAGCFLVDVTQELPRFHLIRGFGFDEAGEMDYLLLLQRNPLLEDNAEWQLICQGQSPRGSFDVRVQVALAGG